MRLASVRTSPSSDSLEFSDKSTHTVYLTSAHPFHRRLSSLSFYADPAVETVCRVRRHIFHFITDIFAVLMFFLFVCFYSAPQCDAMLALQALY